MLSKNVLAASLLLASFQAVFAAPQTATVSIAIDVIDPDDSESNGDVDIQGEIAGVGSDGTTYVLSYAETYTDSDSDSTSTTVDAETFTLVQDATHVSYSIIETADSMSYIDVVACGLDGAGNGVCTEVFEENDTFATETDVYTTSGSILYYVAEITGSGVTAAASTSTSKASSAKSSGSGSTSGSSSAAASSSSSSSGASTILASSFASILASLFGVALLL